MYIGTLHSTNLEPGGLEEHDRPNKLLPDLLSNVETKAPVLVIQRSLLLITRNRKQAMDGDVVLY